jgi:hypothetical protein
MSHKEPSPPKKRRPDPEEHLTFLFGRINPDGNAEQAMDELAQAARRDPRIQEALATLQAFAVESLETFDPEATAGFAPDADNFDGFPTELAPLFGAAYMRVADTLTGGRGFERFGRRLRQGQMLDRVRAALTDTAQEFLPEVQREAVRRAGRSQAFRSNLLEAAHQADWLIRTKLSEVRFGEPFDAAFQEDQPPGDDGPAGLSSAAIAGLALFAFVMVAAG